MTHRGVLFYDGTCSFCRRGIAGIRKPLANIGVAVEPFENGAGEAEMKLRWHDGRLLGGADAALFLARRFPVTRMPATILALPPFLQLTRIAYRKVAEKRHCIGGGACPVGIEKNAKRGGLPAVVAALVPLAAALGAGLLLPVPAWGWMWLIAFSLWFAFKVTTFARSGGWREIDPMFFLWPGMDPAGFAWDRRGEGKPVRLRRSIGFVALGLVLLFGLLPLIEEPLARGWTGIAAMLCLLHFGIFDGMAAGWRKAGYRAEPIMREPWRSGSLGDFWGNRWNRGFSDWARPFLFLPLTRHLGPASGTLAGFALSGIAHELVISLPAGRGFGLPTIYFLIQGLGILIEKKARLRRSPRVRLWLWTVILLPAPLLFHPPFLEGVFNPMTRLIPWTH